MAWTTPKTMANQDPTIYTDWNTYVKDNTLALRSLGLSGRGELIETLSPSASSGITSATLPTSYTHLALRGYNLVASANAALYLSFNGDSGSNYAWANSGYSTADASRSNTGSSTNIVIGDSVYLPAANNYAASFILNIDSYRNTTYNKNIFGNGVGRAASATTMTVWTFMGLWRPATPAAITSITFTPSTGNFTGTICIYGLSD